MRRLSLQGKFAVFLFGFVAVMGTQVFLTHRSVRVVSLALLETRQSDVPELINARDLLNLFLEIESEVQEAMLTGEKSLLAPREQRLLEFHELLTRVREESRDDGPEVNATLDLFDEKFDRQGEVSLELVLRLIDPGSFPEDEARNAERISALEDENSGLIEEFHAALGTLVDEERRELENRLSGVREEMVRRYRMELLLTSVALAGFLVGFFLLARRIVAPLRALSEAAGRVADGNLAESTPIPLLSDDEISDLAGAFERMTRGLRRSTVSRDQLDRILESIPDCVVVCDSAGEITTTNRSMEQLTGWPATELRGRTIDDLVSDRPPDRSTLGEARTRLGRDGRFESLQIEWRTKSGGTAPVMFSGATLFDRSGQREGTVYSAVDFRERKRIESELWAAKQEAEEGVRSKGLFVATMSHEIRTPMAAILGFAELLLDPDQDEKERLEAVRTIRANGQHLLEIINSILEISRIEAGRLEVERIPVPIVPLIDDVARLMGGPARDKRIELRLDYTHAVPAQILTDPTRLRQILLNLIGNAVKFTEAGTIRVAVSYRGDADPPRTGPTLQITIRDTGIGMSEQALAQVFQIFTQADGTTSRRFGGTGLGLAISRRLAELLGGGISVRSREGTGSTFLVHIDAPPVAGTAILPAEEHRRRFRETQEQGESSHGGFGALDRRVLVAEDNRVNQRLIAMILQKAGAVTEVAENGRIAVEKFEAACRSGQPFDVVLMDMQMPEMDGLEATRILRARGHVTPIVALTANAMDSDRVACLDAGCNDFETKPIDRRQLLEKIQRLTSGGGCLSGLRGGGSTA